MSKDTKILKYIIMIPKLVVFVIASANLEIKMINNRDTFILTDQVYNVLQHNGTHPLFFFCSCWLL